MHNWRGFFFPEKTNIIDGYHWTPTSEAFYKTIKRFVGMTDRILEFGSATGHISYRLAKEGYSVTLIDVRNDSIETAREIFKKNKVKGNFYCTDILNHNARCDLAWNSGLVQCFNDSDKSRLIAKLAHITNRILLFYPDVDNPAKQIGTNQEAIPGVGNAREYGIKRIPEIVYKYFGEIYQGRIDARTIKVKFDMYWLYAENK